MKSNDEDRCNRNNGIDRSSGGTTPTGGGGNSGLSDTLFDDDFGVKKKTPHARIVDFIIDTCVFPEDSTMMVKFIDQQGWEEIHNVVCMDVKDIKNFVVYKDHRVYKAKPLSVHLTLIPTSL